MLKSSFREYSDVYILGSATITVQNTATEGQYQNIRKNVMIKNFAQLANYISEINHIHIDNAKDIDVMK